MQKHSESSMLKQKLVIVYATAKHSDNFQKADAKIQYNIKTAKNCSVAGGFASSTLH